MSLRVLGVCDSQRGEGRQTRLWEVAHRKKDGHRNRESPGLEGMATDDQKFLKILKRMTQSES